MVHRFFFKREDLNSLMILQLPASYIIESKDSFFHNQVGLRCATFFYCLGMQHAKA